MYVLRKGITPKNPTLRMGLEPEKSYSRNKFGFLGMNPKRIFVPKKSAYPLPETNIHCPLKIGRAPEGKDRLKKPSIFRCAPVDGRNPKQPPGRY